MLEHIFREFANRGINPFGLDDVTEEDGPDEEDGEFTASSVEPTEISLLMTDDSTFEPDQIEVDAGRPVHLLVENNGRIQHDFTIDDPWLTTHGDVSLTVDAGATETLEFTPEEPGVYEFYCTGEGHTDGPMSGLLVVN
jgi:uncharacterized cupredoxin-like copper-binding protein